MKFRLEGSQSLTERMVVAEELPPATLLVPQSGHGRVDQQLDGVIQPQMIGQFGTLQLDSARRTRWNVLQATQQTRLANCHQSLS